MFTICHKIGFKTLSDIKGLFNRTLSISGDDCFTFQFVVLCESVLTNTTLLMDILEGKLRIQLTGW